ncbi:MAG: PDZ domain-containing protein [Actinomycetota bacterium]
MQQNPWDLPPPAGARPVRPPRTWRLALSSIGVAAFAAAGLLVPLPMFYEFVPGPLRDVGPLVQVTDAPTYSSEGKLYLTTVVVKTRVTAVEWVSTLFDPTKEVVLKQQFTGNGSLEEALEKATKDMEASQEHAKVVVFTELGLGGPEGNGVAVEGTAAGTPAARVLRPGDVIVEVDGRAAPTTCDVGRAIAAHRPGEPVVVKVKRDDGFRTFEVETVDDPEDPGSPLLGVVMSDRGYSFDEPVDVDFETGKIQGPSAGLMMALALYDRLTPDDLTGGRVIAGTGTIECDGGVGPIGGIELKVAGAEARGAEYFLAPAAEADEARAVADDLEVLPISTFSEALGYLRELG